MTGQETSTGFCVDYAFSYCTAIGYPKQEKHPNVSFALCPKYVGGEIVASKEQVIQYTKFLRPLWGRGLRRGNFDVPDIRKISSYSNWLRVIESTQSLASHFN